MKKHFISISAAILLVLSSAACDKITGRGDVYVAGHELIQDREVATVWRNGVAQHLKMDSGYDDSDALSVFVAGKDIYVSGTEGQYGSLGQEATLWKNGTPQRLNERNVSCANSVYVSDNNVYVAGYEWNTIAGTVNPFEKCTPVLWKNGTPQYLSNAKPDSQEASSVFVSGNDVYVVGEMIKGRRQTPTLWKNGTPETLERLNDANIFASINCVFVSDGDVYVSGNMKRPQGKSVPTIWKNGRIHLRLGDGNNDAVVSSIYVSGPDIYAVGYEANGSREKRFAMLWKNGEPQRLSDGQSNIFADSVCVKGKNVYAVGSEIITLAPSRESVALLWKNGEKTVLGKGMARCVFVK